MAGIETVRQQKIRCGKEGCKSCPHGPYWYAFKKVKGTTRSRYIGKKLPPELQFLIDSDSETELLAELRNQVPQQQPAGRILSELNERFGKESAAAAAADGPHPHDAIFKRSTATSALAKEILGITGLWVREQAVRAIERLRSQLGPGSGERDDARLKRCEAAYWFLKRTNKWK